MVTALFGLPEQNVQFAQSSAKCFQTRLLTPWALALHVRTDASDGAAAPDPDRDVGRLFVGCTDGVHAFDLMGGKRQHFQPKRTMGCVTGLAVTDDGARLFAVGVRGIHMFATRTGAATELASALRPVGRRRPRSRSDAVWDGLCHRPCNTFAGHLRYHHKVDRAAARSACVASRADRLWPLRCAPAC
jgi:hypothetical protein